MIHNFDFPQMRCLDELRSFYFTRQLRCRVFEWSELNGRHCFVSTVYAKHLQLNQVNMRGEERCFPDTQTPYRRPPNTVYTYAHTHTQRRKPTEGASMCPLSEGLMSPPALSALTKAALITPSSRRDTKGEKEKAQKRDKEEIEGKRHRCLPMDVHSLFYLADHLPP